MAVEDVMNRDLFFKVSFMHFLTYILIILSIDEEIVEILDGEVISMEKRCEAKNI